MGRSLIHAMCLATLLAFTLGCGRDEPVAEPGTGIPLSPKEAFDGWRPTELRLDPGFPHVAWNPDSAAEARQNRRQRLADTEHALESAYRGRQTREALFGLVWLDLAWSKPEEALQRLEKSGADLRSTADYHHARAAALLMRSELHDKPKDCVLALEIVDRAIAIDGKHAGAIFNRALILERLFLWEAAKEAWLSAARLEPGTGWAAEALERHQALVRKSDALEQLPETLASAMDARDEATLRVLARMDSQPIREAAEALLFSDWPRAQLERDGETADACFSRAETAAGMLPEGSLPRQVGAIIKKTPDEADRDALAGGYLALHQGMTAIKAFRLDEAAERLSNAEELLASTGGETSRLIRYNQALLEFYRSGIPKARKQFIQLVHPEHPMEDPSISGRIYWMLALIDLVLEDPLSAMDWLRKASEAFVLAGEPGYRAGIDLLESTTKSYLGDEEEALARAFTAIANSARSGEARRGYVNALNAVDLLRQLGCPSSALYFQKDAERFANRMGDPRSRAVALMLGSEIALDLGRPRESLSAAVEARSLIPDPPDASWTAVAALASLAEGKARLSDQPERALADFEEALALTKKDDWRAHWTQLLRSRARANIALGRLDRAEADLLEGIALVESRRDRIGDFRQQREYFEQTRKLYDAMIEFQLAQGREQSALDFVERFKIREPVGGPSSQALPRATMDELRNSLSEKTTLLVYALLEGRAVAWTVQKGGIEHFEIDIEPAALTDQISDFVASLLRGESGTTDATELFRVLVGPALPRLKPGDQLALVPDKQLHALPFAALRNPETGRFLVEDHPLIYAPSCSLYADAAARYRTHSRQDNRALVVGNPTVDRDSFPHLRQLPGAAQEARAIADLYPRHSLMIGGDARAEPFLKEAGNHAVVHFGGHAVSGGTRPSWSHLVFAPSPERTAGVLYAHELSDLRLEKTRLVVLAACGGAGGRISPTDGPLNLVRPFLTAGAPAVVASLWDVDDRAASGLFQVFHRNVAEGKSPVTALHRAQLHALQNGALPRVWAGYGIYGGVPPQ